MLGVQEAGTCRPMSERDQNKPQKKSLGDRARELGDRAREVVDEILEALDELVAPGPQLIPVRTRLPTPPRRLRR